MLVLCVFAYVARPAILPDSVAYFENAELFAAGRWTEALQGYWSPGYSLLLVPAAWIAGGDRATLLLIAHLVQAVLGIGALALAMMAVRKRVPPIAQRVVYWGCAWVILRWLTQEFLTPDLLLCVLLLLFVAGLPARSTRDEIRLGVVAGAGFVVKSSIWPWLVVAVAVLAIRCLRERQWRTFPRASVAAGAAVAGVFVLALGVHSGHPTLGSVGPLNVRWYLGDLSRRTPDTDRGPHATKQLLQLPSDATVAVHDLRSSTRTYAPWSDPEAWARGVPATSRSPLNATQMLKSWRQNAGELRRWLLPLVLGITLCVFWSDAAAGRRWWRQALGRPLVVVGAASALAFLAVHAEHRLLAPAALLLLLGAWSEAGAPTARPRFAWLAWAMTAGVAVQLALYLSTFTANARKNAGMEEQFHRFFETQGALNPAPGVIIIGPADRWMGLLWRHHLRVAVQVGAEGEPQVRVLSDQQRQQWLRDTFGSGTLGVGESSMGPTGSAATMRLRFTTW